LLQESNNSSNITF